MPWRCGKSAWIDCLKFGGKSLAQVITLRYPVRLT